MGATNEKEKIMKKLTSLQKNWTQFQCFLQRRSSGGKGKVSSGGRSEGRRPKLLSKIKNKKQRGNHRAPLKKKIRQQKRRHEGTMRGGRGKGVWVGC